MIFKIKYIGIIVIGGLTLSACGYRFAGSGSLPGGTQTVFVEVLENRTAETGIENTFTADLRYEFVRNRMTATKSKAAGILSGVIRSLRVETIARASQTVSQERRVTATVDLNLVDQDGKVLWSVKGISDSEAYQVTADDKTAIDFNKRAAITRLSKRIGESVFYRLTDDF
jgi:outer membrane lipopolysaccharide assembly protein LptE/RlpB